MERIFHEEVYRKIETLMQASAFSEVEKLCLHHLQSRNQPDASLLFFLGTAARCLRKPKPALVAFEAALKLAPDNVEVLQAIASCHELLGDLNQAGLFMARAQAIAPNSASVIANSGVVLEKSGKLIEAQAAYEQALKLDEKNAVANINLTAVFRKLGKKSQALAHSLMAYQNVPQHYAAVVNVIDSLILNFSYDQAHDYCNIGLLLYKDDALILLKKGIVLSCLQEYTEAQKYLSLARVINPNIARELLPHLRLQPMSVNIHLEAKNLFLEAMLNETYACYWHNRAKYIEEMLRSIDDDQLSARLSGPEQGFNVLSLPIPADKRLSVMQNISRLYLDLAWITEVKPFAFKQNKNKKIRLGYLSPDFRRHAVGFLTKQIYQLHNREEFEVCAYALFDSSLSDDYTKLIQNSCDQYFDVSKFSSAEIARKIHSDEIDILIDLAGYTTSAQPLVFCYRPAPLQFIFIGFPSTMGASFIDYAMFDRQFCPDENHNKWSEQVVRLPNSLYPYDNDTDHSKTIYKRADFALPEDAFVFCCLNNSYKIEPVIFDRWMNILKAVPNSVFWLLGKGLDVQDNLEREAEARGVDKSRLIFTGRVPLEQHLPRYQLADLFLDTYWHNAHTTAAEALWQGLPLITIMGEVPSARGAASILTALEMPELIVQSHDEYEQLAIYHATHPEEYAAMREKLKAKRYTAPMYNTKLTVKHIEKAYQMAWGRYQAGLPPAAFDVPENTDPELRKSIH